MYHSNIRGLPWLEGGLGGVMLMPTPACLDRNAASSLHMVGFSFIREHTVKLPFMMSDFPQSRLELRR